MIRRGLLLLMLAAGLSSAIANSDDTLEEEPDFSGNFTLEEGQKLPRSDQSEAYHDQVNDVLASDDFAQKKTVTRWRWIDTENKTAREEKFPEWMIDTLEFFEKNQSVMAAGAAGLEVILWLLLAAAVIFIIYRYHESIRDFASGSFKSETAPELPTTLLGLDLKKEKLPTKVADVAHQLWSQGKHREAVALLLRASLISLIQDFRIKLYDSDTEAECCDRIELRAPNNLSNYMRRLVAAWQSIAYAHRIPPKHEFQALCEAWPSLFKNPSANDNEVTHAS